MKHRNMLPYRPLALLAAISSVAPSYAQQWGGGSQEYCSNQNTGSDYSSVSDSANSFQACSNTCSDGYAFAIVQWENCWCSNYIPADQGDTSDCNQSCPGYPDDKCGNQDQGLYGYVALGPSPSGTAGGGSSSQASSTSAASSTSERVSTSTTSTSSRRERTSSSPPTSFSSSTPDSSTFTSSSSSDSPSESSSPRTSTRTSPLTTSSQTSSSEATTTSSSRRPSTSSSDPPTTSSSSSRTPTTSSTSSTPPPETSSSSSSSTIVEAPVMTSDSSSSIPESATPSPVTSTRVVTISGEPVTETVTSTPMVAPDRQSAETESSSSSSLSGGAIAGVVIGVLAFLALLALAIFLLWRRKRQDPNNPQHGYPEMSSQGASRRPRRNVSVLSKVGLLSRGHETTEDDNNNGEPSSAGAGASSARHSAFFPTGSSHSHGPEASSPLGPQSQNSGSLYQMDSRRHSKPFVYDQRLNPSALFANAEANGSRISMADNTDYSRPLDGLGGGKLQVRNPDPRASFESRA